MKYIVYQTVNKENGKLYIGVHKTENPEIFDGYIGNGVYIGYSLENPKTAYLHALKKYGYKNFVRSTLKVFDNLQSALDYETKLVTPEFVKQKNNYNTCVGGGYLIIYKTIYQFNNQKQLIAMYEGNNEVCEKYGITHNQLQYALNNKKILLDSYFSYYEFPDFEEYSKYKKSDLYQFDFNGNLIDIFKSVKDASEKLNCSFKSLESAVQEKKKYKNNFWTYDPDNIFNIIKITELYNLEYKPVLQFDKNHNFIQEFMTITDASNILGIKYHTIKRAIKENSLVDNKYYFEYTSCVKKSDKIAQYDLEGNLIKIWDSVAQCAKIHPKCREVLKGQRTKTHGYTFKYINN